MILSSDFFKTVRAYLTVFLPKQKCYSPNTVRSYSQALNLLVDYIRTTKRTPLTQITFSILDAELIGAFLDWLQQDRNCSVTTRNQRLMVLRSFFKYAGMMDCGLVFLQMELSKIPVKKCAGRMIEFLSESALAALLDEPDGRSITGGRNRFFMILMYDTAARCQEMLDLRLSDFVLTGKTPYVYLTGKGGKTRAVPLMKKTLDHFHHYLDKFHPATTRDSGDLLFYTMIHKQRCQMSPDNVAAFMKAYGQTAARQCSEVPHRVHPHQLRHTRAIHLYRGGMPLPLISEYLGHADINTTNVYAYADTEMKRAAMEKLASPCAPAEAEKPIWVDDEDMILKLCGLR